MYYCKFNLNSNILRFISISISLPILFLFGCRTPGTNQTKTTTQTDSFRYKIEEIVKDAKGTVGVAISFIATGGKIADTFSYNGDLHLPMQSTYKFPLAIFILQQVDSGKLSLQQKVHISAKKMDQDTWSPMSDRYPDGNIYLSIDSLLRYMVSESDNIACDVLFRVAGGPQKVENYIHSLGVSGIAINTTEEVMHKDWSAQYTNWCEPKAMLQLLSILKQGSALSAKTNSLLWKWMAESKNSPNRIKGLLPNLVVAHKTGTGGNNKEGIVSATNDVGIIVLNNEGAAIEIVVFITDSKADMAIREATIARIAKAAFDKYVTNNY